MSDSVNKALHQLREIHAFGRGRTFPEILSSIRDNAGAIIDAWEWADFGASGKIKATLFPMSPDVNHELLIVRCDGVEAFPVAEDMYFAFKDIQQVLFCTHGKVLVDTVDMVTPLLPGQSMIIEPGNYMRFTYINAEVVFRQSPRIAGKEDDFEFKIIKK